MKYIVTISLLLSLCFIYSCREDTEGVPTGYDAPNMRFSNTALSQNALSNIQVYAFRGIGANNGAFSHRVFNMSQTDNILAMVMPVNTWDFVLLSSEAGDLGVPIEPAVGDMRAATKMWECPSDGSSLLSAPEIITARTGSITINEGDHKTADVSLVRNVAKLKLVIRDAAGLDTGGSHTVSLLNVPNSLTWEGGLYPDKIYPETSQLPMRASTTIRNGAQGNQYSDTLEFIVPAHQGVDFLAINPADTTTHKLTIAIDLEAQGGFRVAKSAVLDVVPKANKILVVNMSVSSTLNFDATIHNWIDENHNVDISQTRLEVSKTNVGLSWRDTVYVNTNAPAFDLAVGDASWLSAQKIDDNRVALTANTASYEDGTPRSTYVDVRANNITKRINVTQRPDEGTITAPESFWVSPSTGNTSRTIAVNSTGPWVLLDGTPMNVLPGIYSGNAGITNITFNRLTSNHELGDYSAYGDTNIRIKNTQTLEIVTVKASNFYLNAPESITMGGKAGSLTREDIKAIGGDGAFTVVGNTSGGWLTTSFNENGELVLMATAAPDNGSNRQCTITISHTNDLNYTKTITIIQDLNMIVSDPFRFLVIRFAGEHPGNATTKYQDLDIGVGFDKNAFSALDGSSSGRYMGYSGGSTLLYGSYTVLTWGSDDAGGWKDGEAVYLDPAAIDVMEGVSPVIPLPSMPKQTTELAQFVYIFCYAGYHTGNTYTEDYTNITIHTYSESYPGENVTMVPLRNTFTNNGGTEHLEGSVRMFVTSKGSSSNTTLAGRNAYVKCCIIRYDRQRHSAQVCFPTLNANLTFKDFNNIPDDWTDYNGNKITWP